MDKRLVSGIAFSREEAVISLSGIPRKMGVEGQILAKISEANIDIDMIAQNTTAQDTIDFTFTVQRREFAKALKIIEALAQELGATAVKTNAKVAKLSLVGIGMRSHSGVASTLFQALGKAQIGIQMITTSEIKISVVVEETKLEEAVRTVHEAFALDKLNATKEKSFVE